MNTEHRTDYGHLEKCRCPRNCDPLGMLCQPLVMQDPVKKRIVTLREEIAQISEANRLYLHGGKKKMPGTTGITNVACNGCWKSLDELVALADWKKV